MRTTVVYSEESAVVCSHNIEAAVGDMGHGIGREVVHFTGDDDRAEFAFGKSRLQIGDEYTGGFEHGNTAEEHPCDLEEVTAGNVLRLRVRSFGHGYFQIISG
jgi:hypothetical protein